MSTTDIVVEFMNSHLKQRGLTWRFTSKEHDQLKKSRQSQRQGKKCVLNEVDQNLTKISNELQEFIKHRAYKDQFDEMTALLFRNINDSNNDNHDNDNISYHEPFKQVADELFSKGISWSHIVTFLVFGAELSCRAIEGSEDTEERYTMVSQIIKWMCTYIDENLLQWINEQDGGWMSIKNHTTKGANNMSMKHYFGMAAFVALVSGLYMCSKFNVQ